MYKSLLIAVCVLIHLKGDLFIKYGNDGQLKLHKGNFSFI